ncbi:MAG: hypothetical protein HGB32_16395 [Geobacteraceae bacterium]|nr:hypothetical protein [Geobacteraceae bacterium]NTW81700.1 hypothetical protein [Geobacteraceae bacterium]
METSSISGSSTQQALSVTMMKQAAEQQNKMANVLAQNVKQAPQPAAKGGSGFNFSTYA